MSLYYIQAMAAVQEHREGYKLTLDGINFDQRTVKVLSLGAMLNQRVLAGVMRIGRFDAISVQVRAKRLYGISFMYTVLERLE